MGDPASHQLRNGTPEVLLSEVAGGLAGEKPHMITAAVKGLARLVYEFSDLIGVAYNLCSCQRVKLLLEMLMRKCGVDVVRVVMPEEHMKLLTNIRKIKERKERKAKSDEDSESIHTKTSISRKLLNRRVERKASARKGMASVMKFTKKFEGKSASAVGTAVVTRIDGRLALGRLGSLCEQVKELNSRGLDVILVTSGQELTLMPRLLDAQDSLENFLACEVKCSKLKVGRYRLKNGKGSPSPKRGQIKAKIFSSLFDLVAESVSKAGRRAVKKIGKLAARSPAPPRFSLGLYKSRVHQFG
ncbi:uncharacterized protein A4U43_C07F3540 [Asparagus officinalis]|uniref:Uncharacterized protein n=1 Tax=Asparagus officinalis TaxID=4686 RepID=A0A5P1E928_ASPOF|nr:uncharacterized protein A4U43_C07F3540 [Asparagus officinalis]